jgi:inositol-phosphate phosphatase/L-galactose 1-phosphate phosphatase/histidinol-phosphatase
MTDDDIDLAGALADAAGDAIRPFYRAPFTIETKPDQSPVTQADRASESAIRAILARLRPDDGVIGEEYGADRPDAPRVWVIDPIDGTRAFMAGRPLFGTLIALIEEGRPILGVIDQPIARDRWLGAAGRPTTLNGVPALWGGDCHNYGLLASGHLDLVVEAGLKLHDYAALVPVVEGAGGRMTDWQGAPLNAASDGRVIAAGDPALLEATVEALA